MQIGLINKIAITPVNITDGSGFKHVCPFQGACYLDKGYCVNTAPKIAKSKDVHLAAIQKNKMKTKKKDRDKWYGFFRSRYERTFSQREKRVRYRGIVKNQAAAYMYAICFNLKRITVLNPLNFCFS